MLDKEDEKFDNFNKLDIDNLYSIQVNYLHVRDSVLKDFHQEYFYSSVDNYHPENYPEIKKSVDNLLIYLKGAKIVKEENGMMDYEYTGSPELLTIFCVFNSVNDETIDLDIKCILDNNGIKEDDDEFVIFKYNGNLLYYLKTEKLVATLKYILHTAYLKK